MLDRCKHLFYHLAWLLSCVATSCWTVNNFPPSVRNRSFTLNTDCEICIMRLFVIVYSYKLFTNCISKSVALLLLLLLVVVVFLFSCKVEALDRRTSTRLSASTSSYLCFSLSSFTLTCTDCLLSALGT